MSALFDYVQQLLYLPLIHNIQSPQSLECIYTYIFGSENLLIGLIQLDYYNSLYKRARQH